MRIALFGRALKPANLPYVEVVLEKLVEEGAEFSVYHTLRPACEEIIKEEFKEVQLSTYANEEELAQFDPHFLISLAATVPSSKPRYSFKVKISPSLASTWAVWDSWRMWPAISLPPWTPCSQADSN